MTLKRFGRSQYIPTIARAEPDPVKIEAIRTYPLPQYTRTEVQKFIGPASCHCKLIPGIAHAADNLTDVFKKDKHLMWIERKDKAARSLIGRLAFSPALALSDLDNHFFLTADVTGSGSIYVVDKLTNCAHFISSLTGTRSSLELSVVNSDGSSISIKTGPPRNIRKPAIKPNGPAALLFSIRHTIASRMHQSGLIFFPV
ncbi:hypothetical protein EPH_0027100 [Eimeria praecox]|uniref:Uncharacterized protein n=1 Tax=Eimeria praecox TaxID=51316 RepID=U6H553_9EIME|nr:hypothetical protein EPH_0027100 [Eimeria praecox]